MKDNRKLLQKIFLILVTCALLAGVSYAFIYFSFLGNETNVINAGCLKLDFVEGENLSLTNAIALTDNQGMELEPYTYTITNTCNTEAYYDTTFNVLNTSGIGNENKIKIFLTGDTYVVPTLLSDFLNVNITDAPNDVRTSYSIDTGYLKPDESKTFYLNMWIDYNATEFNGSMNGKIIIDAIAKEGPSFASKTTGYQIFKNTTLQANSNYSLIAPTVGENAQASGLFLDKDEADYAYYFRGNPTNNYVKFGKYASNTTVTYLDSAGVSQTVNHTQGEDMIWRIIKINSDGSLKLILDDVIGISAFNSANNDSKYTGFVYDTTTDSTIKDVLDTWYATHLETNYNNYIKTIDFCMDSTSTTSNDIIYYGGYTRNITDHNPNSICDNSSIVSSTIGLLTVDELAKAGGLYNTTNTNSYLYKNVNGWWTMSPSKYENNVAYNFISGSNSIDISDVTTNYAIRPVINLKNNLVVSGNGTNLIPYTIVENIFVNIPPSDFIYDSITDTYIKDFNYTGAQQELPIIVTGYYQIELWGARGGNDLSGAVAVGVGGKGGYIKANMHFNAEETIYIYVGGIGGNRPAVAEYKYWCGGETGECVVYCGGGGGGYNGGGSGYSSGGGGGGTDIRLGGNAINNRILVAGGGGGGSDGNKNGLDGGDTTRLGGTYYGGSNAWGGSNCPHSSPDYPPTDGGGGGGGYYGGLAGRDSSACAGGGSNYLNTNYGTLIQNGGNLRSGHGYAKITWIGPTLP